VKILLKNIISFGLSLIFMLTVVHSHPHHGGDHSKPLVLDKDHEVKHDHSIIHECEKCLVKNNKSKVENTFEIYTKSSSSLYKPSSEIFEKNSLPIRLNSRPPPVSHI
jgi:hypothetical protein